MKKNILFIVLLLIVTRLFSQQCGEWPADCPDRGSITASQDSTVRAKSGLLPQEIAMQDAARTLVTGMMKQAAETLHWKCVELDETTNLNPFQRAETPDPVRSPRAYGIAFEFITSEDSVSEWKNWLMDFAERYRKVGENTMKEEAEVYNSPDFKRCYDSVNLYIKMASDYMTNHKKEGAALFEDKELIRLQDKQKEFTDQLARLTNNPPSSGDINALEREKSARTQEFRNASIVEIFFSFNESVGIVQDDGFEVQVQHYALPSVPLARYVHLTHPDINTLDWHFTRWENMIVLFLGNWLANSDIDANVIAGFSTKGQDDEHTPKKIFSDKIQNLAIHVTGNKTNMDQLLQRLDMNKLKDSIVN